ncbi:hypothetical protein [Rhizobium sp. ZX09]|uniref:hypothetical protein n=1 Tax=Rhizobium sp. ZX09 TaxID=2291939 RepID=UPI001A998838|nr:hypothetical protein [Rhizobium sp. ZX09]QSZ56310.1 hypothetical protein BTN45_03615 [Rhizobium sp. ZX09]
MGPVGEFVGNGINQARSTLGSVTTGALKAGFETSDFLHELAGSPVKPEDQTDFRKAVEAQDKFYGQNYQPAAVVSDVSQFVTGMIGAGKLMAPIKIAQKAEQAGKVAKVGYEIGRGALAGGIVLDPHEERLSNLIQQYPALSNPINEYLSADPNDSYMEGRLKNALEGAGMDLALTGIFAGVLKAYRYAKLGDQEAAQVALAEVDTPDSLAALTEAETPKPRVRIKAGSERVDVDGNPLVSPSPETLPAPEGKPRVRVQAGSERVDLPPQAADEMPISLGEKPQALSDESVTVPVKSEASDLPKADAVKPLETPEVSEGPKATTPEVDMAQVLRGTDFDLSAIEQAGSYNEALLQGHKFSDGGSIPWQKLSTPEDVKVLIDNAVTVFKPELDAMKGGDVLKDASVDRSIRQMARYFEDDPASLMRDLSKAGDAAKDMVKQMEAGYLVSNQMFLDTFDIVRKIRAGNLVDFDGDTAAAIAEAKRRLSLAVQAYGESQSIRSNAGRTLRRLQGGFKITPEDLSRINTMDNGKFVDLLYGTEGDPKRLREFATHSFWKGVIDEGLFQMRNGLLWNYKTHAINITGNALMLGARSLEKQIGSYFVRGGSAIRQQAAKEYYYTIASLSDGLKAALDAFDRGDSGLAPHATEWLETGTQATHQPLNLRDVRSPMDLFENLWKANLWHTATGLPTRALGAQDEFFKTVRYRAVVQANAMVQGEAQGLKGSELRDYLEQRLASAFDSNGRATDKAALQEAQTTTFSQDLLPNTWGSTLQTVRNNHPAVGFVLPFVKTPVNVLRMAVKYTPGLNMAQAEYREMIRGARGPEEQARAYGQMALGSLILASSTMLGMSGRITGAGPSDLKSRQELEATGWRPYSLKMENADGSTTYIPLGRLDPTGFVLSVGADLAEIFQINPSEDSYTDAIAASAIAISKNLGERAFLQNIRQAIEAAWSPDQSLGRFAGNIAGNLVPASSAISAYGNDDPYLREARTFIDTVKRRLPGFSETLPPKRDVFGEPVWKQVGLSTVSSPDIVQGEHNRIILETGKGLNLPDPSRNGVDLRDVKLSNGRNAYDLFQEYSAMPAPGKSMKDAIKAVMEAPDYALLPDGDAGTQGTKLWAISGTVSKYREAAYKRLLQEFPELRKQVMQRKVEAAGAYLDNKAERDGSGMTGAELLKRIGF